ncbi:MAG: NAD(P)H-quinone oxidoreductase, partial [Planktomarina sp.]|nr:NAD(P)H-quinone oxidoreductase [Planktomarina sp.]
MTVVEISNVGGPDVLQIAQRQIPEPRYGEVVIKIAYAGINRPDILQRAGFYNPPKGASDLPGLECAGTISEIGAGVSNWQIGDEVCALLPGGGYAEFAATPAAHCMPVPMGLSLK